MNEWSEGILTESEKRVNRKLTLRMCGKLAGRHFIQALIPACVPQRQAGSLFRFLYPRLLPLNSIKQSGRKTRNESPCGLRRPKPMATAREQKVVL
jgi:hypothetical protein